MYEKFQRALHLPKNPRNAGLVSSAVVTAASWIAFSAQGIGAKAFLHPKHFLRSDFFRPDIFMDVNAAFAAKATMDSFKYWRQLKKDGCQLASKKARNAFYIDAANTAVSIVPSVELWIKSGKPSIEFSYVLSPPLIVLFSRLSTLQMHKARELELQERSENKINVQIENGKIPSSLELPLNYKQLMEKYAAGKEAMSKKQLRTLLDFVLQDLNKAYAPNQASQSKEYENLNKLAMEVSEKIASKGEQ